MAKIYGLQSNQIIPGPDFDARQDDNGGWKASQSFLILKGEVDSAFVRNKFRGGVTLTSLDANADAYFSFLTLSKIISTAAVDGGYTRITCEFTGYTGYSFTDNPNVPDPQPTYSMRGVLAEPPINEHPKWKALSDSEKWALGKFMANDLVAASDFTSVGTHEEYDYRLTYYPAIDNDGTPIVFSADAQQFIKRLAQGITTYKLGTYQYSHRWQAESGLSSADMNNLGKIATPSGSPPRPGSGRDWMLVGVSQEQTGADHPLFTNELTYLLSDEGGHDSFLQS